MTMGQAGGVQIGNVEKMIKYYESRFGLDKPLWQQYFIHLANSARFEFGFSIAFFPSKVSDIILKALPWTLGLLLTVTLLSFALGMTFGALLAWPRSPPLLRVFIPPLMGLSAIPYYMVGLGLIYLLAFTWQFFPISGGHSIGLKPSLTAPFVWDAFKHSVLPALSIILTGLGFWALAMRGMMVTTLGEDYMTLAEAKGLKGPRLFVWYGMRNAMLPQVTALALSLGHVASGAILVEVVFGYPGLGGMLYQAIRSFDYTLLYGIVFMVILGIAVATLLLDLFYPRLDPRIIYGRA
jgi:peptide/nickel transport system permease protein